MYYFDSAATTKLYPVALEAMTPVFSESYGNPSGSHAMAREALRLVDESRESIAEALSVKSSEIVFTSGGTEADNLAIRSASSVDRLPATWAIEHHAVLSPVEELGGTVMAVNKSGVALLDDLDQLDPSTSVISCMAANNEIGTIQPVTEIAAVIREKFPDSLFHIDAVQGFCWLDMKHLCEIADLVSLSAHKFGGPKGVGVLVVKSGYKPTPQISGGSQERERRAGTHNVPGIVGMSAAAQATVQAKPNKVGEVAALRNALSDAITQSIDGAIETAFVPGRENLISNISHFCFEGVESEALLFLLERQGIMATAASSCASGAMEPSHVLAAMGYSRELAGGSLRLSLGYETTESQVEYVAENLAKTVAQIRGAKK